MTKASSSENILPRAKSLENGWSCSLDPNTEVSYPAYIPVTKILFHAQSHF